MAKNAIVGQSGGPTSVINASLAGVYESCKRRGAGKVYGMLHGVAGLLERRTCVLDDKLKTALDIELLKRTPSSSSWLMLSTGTYSGMVKMERCSKRMPSLIYLKFLWMAVRIRQRLRMIRAVFSLSSRS